MIRAWRPCSPVDPVCGVTLIKSMTDVALFLHVLRVDTSTDQVPSAFNDLLQGCVMTAVCELPPHYLRSCRCILDIITCQQLSIHTNPTTSIHVETLTGFIYVFHNRGHSKASKLRVWHTLVSTSCKCTGRLTHMHSQAAGLRPELWELIAAYLLCWVRACSPQVSRKDKHCSG